MDTLKSKIAYLNGLIDGLGLDQESKEGRIIKEIASILQDVGEEIEEIKDSQNDIQEYVDELDEDLNSIEEDLYEDEDDYDEEDIEDFIDMTCDNCGETVYIDTAILNGKDSITCPNCHKDIPLHVGCGCSCDDCDDCE